jgi:hypothetical protein
MLEEKFLMVMEKFSHIVEKRFPNREADSIDSKES